TPARPPWKPVILPRKSPGVVRSGTGRTAAVGRLQLDRCERSLWSELLQTLRLLQVSTAPIDRVPRPPAGGAWVGPRVRAAPGGPVGNGASRIGRFIPSGLPGYADVL